MKEAIHVLEPHSHKVQDLVDEYWGDIATPMPDFEGYLRVYPDKGALQRYGGDPNSDVIYSMKAEAVAKFAVWFVIFIILITLGLEMISAPNTIENVIGFFMVVATLYLSVRTKCLTAIKLERKHEK